MRSSTHFTDAHAFQGDRMLQAFPAEPYRLLAEDGTLLPGATSEHTPPQLRDV